MWYVFFKRTLRIYILLSVVVVIVVVVVNAAADFSILNKYFIQKK